MRRVMVEFLYRFGDGYVDLDPGIRAAVASGRRVLWISASGTQQVIAGGDGWLTRTRFSTGNAHAGDGWPVMLEEPWMASSCGLSEGPMGYRSTPPVAVAVVDDLVADAKPVWEAAKAALEGVSQETWDAITEGHPEQPCPAHYCRVKVAREEVTR